MFGEVKLGEADYTVVLETLLFMSNILGQISWKGSFESQSLINACFFAVGKCKKPKPIFCEYDKNWDLCELTF